MGTSERDKGADSALEHLAKWYAGEVQTASLPAMASRTSAPVKREPVAPWRRLDADVAFCFDCEGRARFILPLRPRASRFCCEACAERAGVFGPVSATVERLLDGDEKLTAEKRAERERNIAIYSGMTIPPEVFARPPISPACSGPLSTHGTPVLRVAWTKRDREVGEKMLCNACYLETERVIAKNQVEISDINAAVARRVAEMAAEPPARIGTVPMSIGPGAGIGIWASRGMRK